MRKTDNELAGGWNCVRITSSGEEMLIATSKPTGYADSNLFDSLVVLVG
jgi:hypothetical protein